MENAAAAAAQLGVTAIAVAVLLAGAEPEELVTAVLASARDRPGLAVGDALGSNLTILTAVLGLAALVRPLPVGRRTRRYAIGAAAAGGLALLALPGGIGRGEGALLLAAYAALVAAVWRWERTPPVIGELTDVPELISGSGAAGSRRAVAAVVAGLLVMSAGGAVAVEGAVRLVDRLAVTDTAVGLTVLGLATSAEMFALVLSALRRGVQELAVAAVVGSAAYNATVTLGGAALARPLSTDGALGPAAAAALLPLAVVALSPRGRLGRPAGLLLVVGYGLFLGTALIG